MKEIVLNAGKCSWGKCLFCGWGKDGVKVSAGELIEKFDCESGDAEVKLFCSGSLLDDKQFPIEFQQHLAKSMQGRVLYVESRPEYVTDDKLALFKGVKLVVAIGLEAGDNEVLKKLNKGITVEAYKKACGRIHAHGFKVKSYILVNHPFDYDGLLDKSVTLAKECGDEIVLINTFPHAKSGLFDLWVAGEWKPISEQEFLERTNKYEGVQLEPNNYAFMPKFPMEKKADLNGVGVEFIDHAHFNVWQDYLARLYNKPVNKTIALFVPCSKKKPYYNSRTHVSIRRAITGFDWYKNTHIIVISNPGVIPIEFADKYPFNAYDWDERNETPEVMKEYIRINTQRVKDYLNNHKYERVFSYYKPSSESGQCLKNACKELGIKLIDLCDEQLMSKINYDKNPLIHPLMIRALRDKMRIELQ